MYGGSHSINHFSDENSKSNVFDIKGPWVGSIVLSRDRPYHVSTLHYNDVIMAYQITSLTIVCSTVYSGADPRKYQSSASLTFVRGIHRWPVNSSHKGPVMRKIFPFHGVIRTFMVVVTLSYHAWISLKISLKFVSKVGINHIPTLVQVMAWCHKLNSLSCGFICFRRRCCEYINWNIKSLVFPYPIFVSHQYWWRW